MVVMHGKTHSVKVADSPNTMFVFTFFSALVGIALIALIFVEVLNHKNEKPTTDKTSVSATSPDNATGISTLSPASGSASVPATAAVAATPSPSSPADCNSSAAVSNSFNTTSADCNHPDLATGFGPDATPAGNSQQ